MAESAHVMIVDDDADLREVVTLCLEAEGHSVSTAADGGSALAALASGPRADVIILDLAMPVMDGQTFLAHKALSAHALIPVVIFSSSPSNGLEKLPDVVAVILKTDGIVGLLGAVARARRSRSLAGAPGGGFHG